MYAAVNLVSDKISVWYNYKAWSFERLAVFWEKNARRSVAYELSEEIVSCRVFKLFLLAKRLNVMFLCKELIRGFPHIDSN